MTASIFVVLAALGISANMGCATHRDTTSATLISINIFGIKKRYHLLTLLFTLLITSVSSGQTFSGTGTGTSSDPYIITSGSELREVDNFLNDSSVYFELGSNIDLSGYSNWDPIGDDSNIFTGQFNGNGYTISGLQINNTTPVTDPFPTQYTGLFARSEGTIENVTLSSVNVTGQYNVGGLVGDTEGNISNVFVSGTVNGEHNVGGVAGMNLGTIQTSSSSADVEVPNNGGNAGGLVGRTGEAGWPGVTIQQSHATGKVIGGQNSGGLVGLLYNASVVKSYATSNVTGGFTAGGLIGMSMDGNISKSFATGDVNGAYDVGGLVGINEGSISQSYAVGNVTATQPGVGGLVGTNESSGTVTESYSAGFVDGNENKSERGGFIGDNNASSSAITTSFWDTNSSGYTSSAGGTGKTTTEMTSSSTFSSWDSGVWDWPTGNYPKLEAISYDDSFDMAAPSAPTASTSGGTYNADQTISLNGESGASIYYTLDGSTPTTASTSYSSSITISSTTTLKAIAVDPAGNVSTVLTETYTIDKTAPPAPTANISGGTYNNDQTITLSGESGASIYYTLDGSTPTTASTSYSSSITISSTTTLKAIAVDPAGNVSTVLTETYTIDKTAPPAPTASPSSGSYNADQTITLSGESGASIYYTLDGNTPTTASTSYSSSITISSTTTLKAIAVDGAGNDSPVLVETYTIDKTVPAVISFNPVNGAHGIDAGTNLEITFDESMVVGSGNVVVKKSSDDQPVKTIDVTGGQVSGSGSITMTINPSTDLSNNSGYYVTIDGTAFRDEAGNYYPGINDASTWQFETVDTKAPSGSVVINSGEKATNNSTVNLEITESGSAEMRFSHDNNNWSSWEPVTSGKTWTLNNGDGDKTVYMQLRDTAGNVSTSISDTITLDTTTPEVTGISDGEIVYGDVVITFNEGTTTLNGSAFASGGTVSTTGDYTLVVTDAANNKTTINFTINPENRPPSITSSPVELARMVQPYNYTVEAEDPDTSNSIAFSATLSDGGDLPSWLNFTDNGDATATFSGTPGEEDMGSYTVEVVAIDDGTPRQQSSQEFTLQVKYKEVTELKALYNYPNPFRNETKIKFELPEKDQVYLQIYNTTGSLVRQTDPRTFQPGANEFDFQAYNLTSGIYIYRIISSNEVTTGRLVLTR